MSETGNFIAVTMKYGSLSAKAIAKQLGTNEPTISRIVSGSQTRVRPVTLRKMVSGISDDPVIRAKFLAAYMSDQLKQLGDVANLVEVRLRVQSLRSEDESGTYESRKKSTYNELSRSAQDVALDPKSAVAIEKIIQACGKSPRFCRSMRDLAEIAEHDILGR